MSKHRKNSYSFKPMTPKAQKFATVLMFALSAIILAACWPQISTIQPISVTDMVSKDQPAPAPQLYCQIGRGSALFGRDWYDFQDTPFGLNRGAPARVLLTRTRGDAQMTIQALFDASGQKLIFCPYLNVAPGEKISCTSLYMLEDDFKAGIRRTFDIPQAVRGGQITCAYDSQKLQPLSTGRY